MIDGMLSFEAAQAAVAAACRPLPVEYVALHESAGRTLARDVIAREDLVPFARSAMDGYAVRAADVGGLPATLRVAGNAYAAPGAHTHLPGTATAIATGAPIPAGADCVIPFEHVDAQAGSITVSRHVVPGASIFPPGDDARRGELLVARGVQLTPATIALLAAAGAVRVEVHRRPIVAIIGGGDELVGIDRTPVHGQVRDSNGILLATALAAAGADVIPPLRLSDDRDVVREALARACDVADLVVTTGGASVGERDFVKRACADIGVRFLFRSVALRPAKPTAIGLRGDTAIVVLAGNPAAAFVGLHEFAVPAVRALSGYVQPWLPRIDAMLCGSVRAKPGRHFAAFASVSAGPQGLMATPLENQCSSLTRTAATAAGFILVPPGVHTLVDGARVAVDIFDWARVTTGARRPAPQDVFALT